LKYRCWLCEQHRPCITRSTAMTVPPVRVHRLCNDSYTEPEHASAMRLLGLQLMLGLALSRRSARFPVVIKQYFPAQQPPGCKIHSWSMASVPLVPHFGTHCAACDARRPAFKPTPPATERILAAQSHTVRTTARRTRQAPGCTAVQPAAAKRLNLDGARRQWPTQQPPLAIARRG
jgi:hypothetical protein